MDINTHIVHLQEKLQLLIKAYKQLQKENSKLQRDLVVLHAEQENQQQQLAQMEQRIAAVQITGTPFNDIEKQALQKKIDTYLKEIEKCLALLHA